MDSDTTDGPRGLTALASLRRFARPRVGVVRERCALCNAELSDDHSHLVEPSSLKLACACEPCAILFSDQAPEKYRRVPRRIEFLPDFRLTDVAWEGLQLPIDLAFFLHAIPAGRVIALYPSPAGATEAPVSPGAWGALVEENPILRDFEPNVEGLLVNRVGEARECYRVGIDECFRLVGLLRSHWRGLSGGPTVWGEIACFFAGLRERSS